MSPIVLLLTSVADGDRSAIGVLADALEEAGDTERASKCRGTAYLCEPGNDPCGLCAETGKDRLYSPLNESGVCRYCHGTKIGWRATDSIRTLLMSFPDYCPPECVVSGWKIPKELQAYVSGGVVIEPADIAARRRHKGAQRKFKAVLKGIRIGFNYRPSDGSLVLAFPSTHQHSRLKVALRAFYRSEAPLFQEASQ